ncbi:hypothetical protein PENTCL1PPCAC_14916, partial [Pristionchus entomophagus]
FDVNLDAPAAERFKEIASKYTDSMNALIQVVKDLLLPVYPNAVEVIDDFFGAMHHKLDQPYRDEIQGIADASGIPLGQIVMYNVIYEFLSACTSIIAVDENDSLYHVRNLDFGLWIGWDPVNHAWELSRALSNNIVNIRWIKGGQVLYKSNNFAGFVGVYNGLKQGKFALTANSRFGKDGETGRNGMIKWLTGEMPDGKWMTWLARETMENANSYAEAKEHLMNTEML